MRRESQCARVVVCTTIQPLRPQHERHGSFLRQRHPAASRSRVDQFAVGAALRRWRSAADGVQFCDAGHLSAGRRRRRRGRGSIQILSLRKHPRQRQRSVSRSQGWDSLQTTWSPADRRFPPPPGLPGLLSRSRVSMSGAQEKLVHYRRPQTGSAPPGTAPEYRLPVAGAPSTVLVKRERARFPGLLQNELAAMAMMAAPVPRPPITRSAPSMRTCTRRPASTASAIATAASRASTPKTAASSRAGALAPSTHRPADRHTPS